MAALERVPGKIVAVHVSYRSRAAERGTLPAWPSYFLKPSSSLAESGDQVARPPGCELLAFEGEVALVIGRRARRVSRADGWDHVAWITAANDFGVYDLRYADRGSNVRSKGIDGFTPLGPRLIDARAVDLATVRLRTWVNGDLTQDAWPAQDMLFGFGDIVADLSRPTGPSGTAWPWPGWKFPCTTPPSTRPSSGGGTSPGKPASPWPAPG
jgi:5-oxopent-3-ene-1,2,5-tricarboxylate decarboxylase / 2-hydroxyhepta-2,4-diene-1,7-dioate isomerase